MSRVAIVTGAARGIGAATVDALVADGYRVVAVDRYDDAPAMQVADAREVIDMLDGAAIRRVVRGGALRRALFLLAAREEVGRSEERRVGKECRSRWSPYH